MAIIYPTIWEQGDKRERLSLGYHYKKHVKSLVVPEGQIVTIYENQDRTGRKSLPLHAGNYHHLSFYGISENPGVVHIEKTGVRLLDLVEIGWNIDYDKELMKRTRGREGKYPIYYAVPIGDKRQGVDFPNDRIQWLKIPFGVIVEVFDDDYFKGGSLIFSGNTQGEKERVNLWDYKDAKGNPYSWRTSSMKIRADDWVSAGVSIENESISAKDNDKFAGVFELGNNSPFDSRSQSRSRGRH